MAVATVKSGMNWPLHSGHDRPHPSAEPVLVTAAPITSTSSMPAHVSAASQRSAARVSAESVDRKDGLALHAPLTERFQGADRIAPARFESNLGLQPPIADLSGEQRQVSAKRWRLARFVDEK